MSATLEVEKFCKYFGTKAAIEVKGRAFPIEIFNSALPHRDYIVILIVNFSECFS